MKTMTAKPVIMVVAALMPELGIGYNGGLPWRLKGEMANFKKITTTASDSKRNAVIMGRKTWESIPTRFRPLPDRLNIVLSRTSHESTADLVFVQDFNGIQEVLNESIDKVFLMGGAELYNMFFQKGLAEYIVLTEVTTAKQVPIDTTLDWDLLKWSRRPHAELEGLCGVAFERVYVESGYEYRYQLYQRRGEN